MTNRLPIPWVRHLKDPDSKVRFEQSVRASVTALSRLHDLLDEEEELLHNQESSTDDYFGTTDWAYKQAFRNGKKAQIREIKRLLSFIKDKG